jgi:hypothetical protein
VSNDNIIKLIQPGNVDDRPLCVPFLSVIVSMPRRFVKPWNVSLEDCRLWIKGRSGSLQSGTERERCCSKRSNSKV